MGAYIVTSFASHAKCNEDSDVVESYSSYAFGKEYRTEITEGDIKKCPRWCENADNPPLSIRKAMRIANGRREKLVHDTELYKWRLESVTLEFFWYDKVPYEIPYWRVHYEAHGVHGGTGISPELDLFVLMNGALIEPIINVDKRLDRDFGREENKEKGSK